MISERPAPEGQEIELMINCAASPDQKTSQWHRVVIDQDWTVHTPHDPEAERIARAFGGWNSCSAFINHVIPAYHRALALMADPRRLRGETRLEEYASMTERMNLRASVRNEIRPEVMFDLFPGSRQVNPALEVERGLYWKLFARAGRLWAEAENPAAIDEGADGYFSLWTDGLRPADVAKLAAQLPRTAWPLSPRFYYEAHFGEIDLDWLVAVVQCFPEKEFAEWAVQLKAAALPVPADWVWRLQQLGLSSRDAMSALESQLPIETLTDLANLPDVGGPTAARWLTVWARLGVTPTSSHYRLLESNRALLDLPPLWILDSVVHSMRRLGADAPARVELAVMLALTTDMTTIEDAIRTGVREATDIRFIQRVHKRRNP